MKQRTKALMVVGLLVTTTAAVMLFAFLGQPPPGNPRDISFVTVENDVTPSRARLVLVVDRSATGGQAVVLLRHLDSLYYSKIPWVMINAYNSSRAAARLQDPKYPIDSISIHWIASLIRNNHTGVLEVRAWPGR